MRHQSMKLFRTAVCSVTVSLLAVPGFLFAQDDAPPPPPDNQQQQAPPSPGGWRRTGNPPANQQAQSTPRATMDPNYGPSAGQSPDQQSAAPPPPIPAKLTIKPGTFVTVRLNQGLSSDRNQQGDAFAATLVKPIVVDGIVVAERGQTVAGRVVEAKKAGRVQGVSRLGIQLTDLTLADGQPVSIQSQLVNRNGRTSEGRDAGAVAATTATGAAIGAAADWGTGAAIGAGAGAVAGIVGVLLTRGHATVLYPEQVLTFRVDTPVTVSTDRAPQAFRYVNRDDYEQPQDLQARFQQPPTRPAPYYYAYPYPYYWGGYWGPRIGFYWGPSFYWGRGFYRGGFYRGGFYGHGFRRWR